MNTKWVYFGIIIVILVLAWFSVPQVWAQQSTRQQLKVLEAEGEFNCEIWQINDFLYKPVRINLSHQRVDNHQVSITTEGGGESFWDGSPETFQMVARDTDRYQAKIVLDYELKHEDPRQIFYQVFAKDNTLMMEGNWVHEGFTFCKIIQFFAQQAPEELTAEQIQQENNKFNADFREEQAQSNTTIETGILVFAIVLIIIGILVTVFFVIIIMSMNQMAGVSKRPAKKLNEMIDVVRNLADVMRLQTKYSMTEDKDMREKIVKMVDSKLGDLSIMFAGTKDKVNLKESFPSAESLVPEVGKPVSVVPPEKSETENAKQQKINEESYGEGYGTESLLKKGAQTKEEITLATLLDREDQEIKESLSDETDAETVEMSVKDIIPCDECGKDPDYVCEDCEKMFCKDHQNHKCKGAEKKSLGASSLISTITDKIVKSVFDKKDSIVTSDEKMQKLLDGGKSKEDVITLLVKEYMKIPYKEARKIYDDMGKEYEKGKTFPKAVRIQAMMERLVRSNR